MVEFLVLNPSDFNHPLVLNWYVAIAIDKWVCSIPVESVVFQKLCRVNVFDVSLFDVEHIFVFESIH